MITRDLSTQGTRQTAPYVSEDGQFNSGRSKGVRNLFRYGIRKSRAISSWLEIRSRMWSALLLLFLTCLLRTSAFAQFSIDWFTIDAGGGTSTGGVFSVSGTIGQPDANPQPLTGGNFSLVGGFWSLFAVQSPGAPLLTIRLTTTNTAIVSWPSPSTGFVLQQNTDINTTNWVGLSGSLNDDGTSKFIVVNPPAGNRFYRLFKP